MNPEATRGEGGSDGNSERDDEEAENVRSRQLDDPEVSSQGQDGVDQYMEQVFDGEGLNDDETESGSETYSGNEGEHEEEEEYPGIEGPDETGTEESVKYATTSEIPLTTRSRKSIYERDSFIGSVPSFVEGDSSEFEVGAKRGYRVSTALGFEGIARISLSPLTQRIVGCVIGENVTTEYPWIYVKKEVIEDNIDLHDRSSDFLPIKDAVGEFPGTKMLIGYAPSSNEEGQFYICVTEAGQDAVIENIDALRAEQENRVRNAVYKSVGTWTSLGSEIEVNYEIEKNTRPLLEIEVQATSNMLNQEMHFSDRGADDQRDGYVELRSDREHFEIVTRTVIGRGDQGKPSVTDSEAQTDPSMPNNMWTQYDYDCPMLVPEDYDEEKAGALADFVDKYTDEVCDYVTVNENWDVYYNDYVSLVRNERDTHPPEVIKYLEHQSYSDGRLCKDRVINSLAWHPLWTGTAAAAYTHHSKVETLSGPEGKDEVRRACEGNNKVLIWSFTDCLTPKLVLDSPREVTAVSFCPLDGNVIVGGCANGQIAIWDIAGKIEQIETVVVRTAAQIKYRVAMQSLMTWMNETTSSSAIRPAAMSSLQHSQVAPITGIVWVPPYNKLDKNGRIQSLPKDTPVADLHWQFVTSSEDGTIAFWDLKYTPSDLDEGQAKTKIKKKGPRPEPLIQAISPYKQLDRIFRPDYKLTVKSSDEIFVPLIAIDVYYTKFPTVQLTEEAGWMNITTRRYHEQVIEKPDYEMEPYMVVGTSEGDLMRITWDGYEFSTGMLVNTEPAVVIAWNKIHDGPVTVIARSKYVRKIIITVGGKVFALWRDDSMNPILWRKSMTKYTACCWGSCRPTVFLLAQSDGTVEIWDLMTRSEKPTFTQSVSGQTITSLVTHELYLNPRCIAFTDYNGTLRVFTAPDVLMLFEEGDIKWLEKFVDREVERIDQFQEWQTQWNATNLENIERKRILAEIDAEKHRVAEADKKNREMAEAALQIAEKQSKQTRSRPEEFLARAKEHWKSMELRRMQTVILDKKGLRKDDLEKQRAPMMMLREEVHRKKKKIKKILQMQDKIFEDSIAFLFPDQYRERKAIEFSGVAITKTKSGAEDGDDLAQLLRDEEGQVPVAHSQSPEEEIILQFLETQAEALEMVRRNPYKPTFVWRKVLTEGKYRRKVMDLQLARRNGHRREYMDMKSVKEAVKTRAKGGTVWFTPVVKQYDVDEEEAQGQESEGEEEGEKERDDDRSEESVSPTNSIDVPNADV